MQSTEVVKILNEIRKPNLGVFVVVVDEDGNSKHHFSGAGCLIGMGLCNAMMQTHEAAVVVEAAAAAYAELDNIDCDVMF